MFLLYTAVDLLAQLLGMMVVQLAGKASGHGIAVYFDCDRHFESLLWLL